MDLLEPKTYPIKNAAGEKVGSVTAADATEIIDPNAVAAKIKEINSLVSSEIKKTKKVLNGYAEDSTEAIIIEGASMKKPIDELADAIGEVPGDIESLLADVQSECEKAHSEIQEANNEAAKEEAERRSGQ